MRLFFLTVKCPKMKALRVASKTICSHTALREGLRGTSGHCDTTSVGIDPGYICGYSTQHDDVFHPGDLLCMLLCTAPVLCVSRLQS